LKILKYSSKVVKIKKIKRKGIKFEIKTKKRRQISFQSREKQKKI
jgi:hypothetical protein